VESERVALLFEVALVAPFDVFKDLVDGQAAVSRAEFLESFIGLEGAAPATADVVAGEEGPLGAGTEFEQPSHGDGPFDRGRFRTFHTDYCTRV
jgi:hypothetical protein